MPKQKQTVPFTFAVFCVVFCTLIIGLFFPLAVVYALPDQDTAWVEVQCTSVPKEFSSTATVVLSSTETGEYYTITCHKVNDYIGRLALPVGKYQVEHTSTADNFAYEATTTVDTFELKKDMPAAYLITVSVIKHDTSYTVPEAEAPVAPVPGDTEAVPETAVPSTSDTPSQSQQNTVNSILDFLQNQGTDQDASDVTSDAENPDDADTSVPSAMRSIFKAIVGTLIFVALVFVIAYFVRQHNEE